MGIVKTLTVKGVQTVSVLGVGSTQLLLIVRRRLGPLGMPDVLLVAPQADHRILEAGAAKAADRTSW